MYVIILALACPEGEVHVLSSCFYCTWPLTVWSSHQRLMIHPTTLTPLDIFKYMFCMSTVIQSALKALSWCARLTFYIILHLLRDVAVLRLPWSAVICNVLYLISYFLHPLIPAVFVLCCLLIYVVFPLISILESLFTLYYFTVISCNYIACVILLLMFFCVLTVIRIS